MNGTISRTAVASREAARRHDGTFGEQTLTDPGDAVLSAAIPPTVDDLAHTTIRPDRVFAAAARCSRRAARSSSNPYTKATLNNGYVYASDGHILMRARCGTADNCSEVGVDPIQAKRAAAATKGQQSPGVRVADLNNTWLEIGGQPLPGTNATLPSHAAEQIIDSFNADWDDTAVRGRPEKWQATSKVLAAVKSLPADGIVAAGNTRYPAERVEAAMRMVTDLGVRSVLIRAQSQHWGGQRKRRPYLHITGAGVDIIIMGTVDRSLS